MEMSVTPFWLAAATTVCFGFLAWRAGRSVILWAISGVVLGLVVSTIIFGLGQSVAIPFTEADIAKEKLRWTLESVAVLVVLGWVFTLSLHRTHQLVLRTTQTAPAPLATTAATAPEPPADPKAPTKPK